MIIWISRDSARYGPYTLTAVLRYLEEGSLDFGDLAWTVGFAEWTPLREALVEFSTILDSAKGHQQTEEGTSKEVSKDDDENLSEEDEPLYDTDSVFEKIQTLLDSDRGDHAYDLAVGSRDRRLYEKLFKELPGASQLGEGKPLRVGGESRFWFDLLTSCPYPDAVPDELRPENIEHLSLANSPWLTSLDELKEFVNLRSLQLNRCENLSEVDLLSDFESLKELELSGCGAPDSCLVLLEHPSLEKLSWQPSDNQYSLELVQLLKRFHLSYELRSLISSNWNNPDAMEEILQELHAGNFLEEADFDQTTRVVLDAVQILVETYHGSDPDKVETFASLANSLFRRMAARASTVEEYLMVAKCNIEKYHANQPFAREMVDMACGAAHEHGLDIESLSDFISTCCGGEEYFDYLEAYDRLLAGVEELNFYSFFEDGVDEWPEYFESWERGEQSWPGPHKFPNLKNLDLSGQYFEQLPPEISELPKLRNLRLEESDTLVNITALADVPGLEELRLLYCTELENLDVLAGLEQLTILDLTGCSALKNLPDLSKLKNLETLHLDDCESLENADFIKDLEIEDLRLPEHLQ